MKMVVPWTVVLLLDPATAGFACGSAAESPEIFGGSAGSGRQSQRP